jgi:hypothetical protein
MDLRGDPVLERAKELTAVMERLTISAEKFPRSDTASMQTPVTTALTTWTTVVVVPVSVDAEAGGHISARECEAWVQCESCNKWRRVPQAMAEVASRQDEGRQWTCRASAHPRINTCEVPQELDDDEIDARIAMGGNCPFYHVDDDNLNQPGGWKEQNGDSNDTIDADNDGAAEVDVPPAIPVTPSVSMAARAPAAPGFAHLPGPHREVGRRTVRVAPS